MRAGLLCGVGLCLALVTAGAGADTRGGDPRRESAPGATPEILAFPPLEPGRGEQDAESRKSLSTRPPKPRAARPVEPVAPATSDREYIVGAHDIIEIHVFDEPELSKEAVLSPQGRIGFPLLGTVDLGGLTVSEVERLIKRELSARFLVDPQVFVSVKEYNSRRAMVLGMVKEPSAYSLKGETTILDLLSRAGGMLDAGGKNLVLLRGGNLRAGFRADLEPIVIDAHRLLRLGEGKLNLTIEHGDILFVPKADGVYVYGEVRKPGVVAHRDGLTVLQAVSLAEGLTTRARASRVQVIRAEAGRRVKFQVNLDQVVGDAAQDIKLKPEDIIVVPESFF